jgi:hypothetical protein
MCGRAGQFLIINDHAHRNGSDVRQRSILGKGFENPQLCD